jgi:hypothetical protein
MAVQEYGREREYKGSGLGPIAVFAAVILALVALGIWRTTQTAADQAFEAACLDAGGRVGTVGSVHGCFPESIRTIVLEVEAP